MPMTVEFVLLLAILSCVARLMRESDVDAVAALAIPPCASAARNRAA